MVVKRLAAREVDRAPLAIGSSYYIMEGGGPESLNGFGVRVGRREKWYVVRFRRKPYKIPGGRCDVMPIEVARTAARELLLRLMGGEVVAAAHRTVRQLSSAYMERHSRVHKAAKSTTEDQRMWDLHILPFRLADGRELGSLGVGQVTAEHVSQLHVSMQAKPYAANRILALLSNAFNLCCTWRWVDAHYLNPTRGVQRYPERSRRSRHFSTDEYVALFLAIAEAREARTVSDAALGAVELMAYTGARPGEAKGLDWAWLQRELDRFRLPTAKGDRPRDDEAGRFVWLNGAAYEVLRRQAAAQGWIEPDTFPPSGPVFPGKHGRPLATLQKAWEALCTSAGITNATPKTLRHSFVTIGPDAGVSLELMADLAGHRDAKLTDRVYRARVDEQQRAAAEKMGAHLQRKMASEPEDPPEGSVM